MHLTLFLLYMSINFSVLKSLCILFWLFDYNVFGIIFGLLSLELFVPHDHCTNVSFQIGEIINYYLCNDYIFLLCFIPLIPNSYNSEVVLHNIVCISLKFSLFFSISYQTILSIDGVIYFVFCYAPET